MKNLLAVRKCNRQECRNSICWAKIKDKKFYSRKIPGTAFLPTIFALMNWNPNYKYRIRGNFSSKYNNELIIFNMRETEVFISQNNSEQDVNQNILKKLKPFTAGPKKDIVAFPENWANAFGENYYRQAQINELANWNKNSEWNISETGISYSTNEPEVTSHNEICRNIQMLTQEIKQESLENGE